MRRLVALLLFLGSIPPASAQTGLLSHWRGNDIELVPGTPAGPCVGDLIVGDLSPLWQTQLIGSQTTCPIVVAGDGVITGVEGTRAYFLEDTVTPWTGSAGLRTERHFDAV